MSEYLAENTNVVALLSAIENVHGPNIIREERVVEKEWER